MKLGKVAALMLASTGPAHANLCGIYEAVEPGDTLHNIAERCDASVEMLFAANPGIDARNLEIGSVIRVIPADPARAMWTELAGNWSEDGICFGKEVIAGFTSETLYFGETGCNVAALQIVDDTLIVKASNCQSEGEPSASQTVTITPQPDGTIQYNGFGNWQFRRCSDL